MFGQDFPVHPRPVVEALEVGGRHEAQEVAVTGLGLGEDGEMVREAVVRVPLEPASRRYVSFDPENWLNAQRLARLVEVDCAVNVAVVGEGDGRHAEFSGPGSHVVEPAQAVEQAVLGMVMEMDKLIHGGGNENSCWAARDAFRKD